MVNELACGENDVQITQRGVRFRIANRKFFVQSWAMRKLRFAVTLIVLLSCSIVGAQDKKSKKVRKPNPAMAKVEDVAGLPRVLIVGDSISIGYTVGVRKLLEGKANLHRPLANCGPTHTAVKKIDEWLQTGGDGKKWDVIHFNWGLHDLKYMGADGSNLADPKNAKNHQQVPPAEYEKNLTALVEKLKATGAKLIWRNTTPVPPGTKGRLPGDSVIYNKIATKIMTANDIPTHDLYTVSKERMDELMLPANVHFKPAGSKVLAELVTARILEELK